MFGSGDSCQGGMASLPLASEHAQHSSPAAEDQPWAQASLSTNIAVCRCRLCGKPQILEVQMKEPVWQVFHGPGFGTPSNLGSPVCLYWSFSCYPLCRVSFLPVCAGQPAVRLPSASLTFLGVASLQEQLKKSTSEYSAFQQFFSSYCVVP